MSYVLIERRDNYMLTMKCVVYSSLTIILFYFFYTTFEQQLIKKNIEVIKTHIFGNKYHTQLDLLRSALALHLLNRHKRTMCRHCK
jgi:hypothetical protein